MGREKPVDIETKEIVRDGKPWKVISNLSIENEEYDFSRKTYTYLPKPVHEILEFWAVGLDLSDMALYSYDVYLFTMQNILTKYYDRVRTKELEEEIRDEIKNIETEFRNSLPAINPFKDIRRADVFYVGDKIALNLDPNLVKLTQIVMAWNKARIRDNEPIIKCPSFITIPVSR